MPVEVKICGIKTADALDAAIAAGADYCGLNFFPKSPRVVTFEQARLLAARARAASAVRVVAVVVDPDDALLDAIIASAVPDIIQLHGKESAERIASIRRRYARRILKAVSVATVADVEQAAALRAPGERADLLMYDAKAPKDAEIPGGNGLTFDWRILSGVPRGEPYVLAGGLNPDNVAAAIALTGAPIVDVASGVERTPGEKDADLIRRFVLAAKGDRR